MNTAWLKTVSLVEQCRPAGRVSANTGATIGVDTTDIGVDTASSQATLSVDDTHPERESHNLNWASCFTNLPSILSDSMPELCAQGSPPDSVRSSDGKSVVSFPVEGLDTQRTETNTQPHPSTDTGPKHFVDVARFVACDEIGPSNRNTPLTIAITDTDSFSAQLFIDDHDMPLEAGDGIRGDEIPPSVEELQATLSVEVAYKSKSIPNSETEDMDISTVEISSVPTANSATSTHNEDTAASFDHRSTRASCKVKGKKSKTGLVPLKRASEKRGGSRRPEKKCKKSYFEFTEKDVLSKRGGLANKHKGNIAYHNMAARLRPIYRKATKSEKTQIAQQLLDQVHDSGGRFLKKDNLGWFKMKNNNARTKCAQLLREGYTKAERAAKRRKYK